jgi:putative membrane protein
MKGVTGTESSALLPLRGAFGGLLMGLANLVPGISGGTMLLAAGVYPEFIGGIAELSTLRFRWRSIVLLASVLAAASLAILLFAGPTKDLVVEHRWIMYSIFIGLTLGGVPIVWRLARPLSKPVVVGALFGLAVMIAMAWSEPGADSADSAYGTLFVAGVLGASAMILPGVSGGYLLLLLGQYIPILSAVDDFKTGLLGPSIDWDLVVSALKVGIPVGIGVVLGVVGVSNLLKWLLERYRKPTLGVLLGLLFGAVIGLWPFQRAVEPSPGDRIKGVTVTAENRTSFDRDDWPTERFPPDSMQVLAAGGLILFGILTTHVVGRLGRDETGP